MAPYDHFQQYQLTVLISADVLLKMITILKELRIVQLCSKNEQTLVKEFQVNKVGSLMSQNSEMFWFQNQNKKQVKLRAFLMWSRPTVKFTGKFWSWISLEKGEFDHIFLDTYARSKLYFLISLLRNFLFTVNFFSYQSHWMICFVRLTTPWSLEFFIQKRS